jgi:hypothetical protein
VISAPNTEETTWMQESVTSTAEKTTLNIGTGTVQISGEIGSDTPLSDVLELI